MRVESGKRVDVVTVGAGTTARAAIDVDDGLKNEGGVGGGGIEEWLPGIIARIDVERYKNKTGVDHDGNKS